MIFIFIIYHLSKEIRWLCIVNEMVKKEKLDVYLILLKIRFLKKTQT